MARGRNILVLNDDCLYHIYEFLPIIDWCSLRDTCTRFRTISDDQFNRRSKTFKLSQISDRDRLKLSEVKRVLRTFGKSMKTLSINQNHFAKLMDWNGLAPFLERYCESLVDLELVSFRLTAKTVVQCRRLFSNLQRLVIDKWDNRYRFNVETFSTCLVECTSLTELVFIGLDDITEDSFACSHMKYLKSFELRGCYGLSDKAFKSFLTKNCQLTQVKLFDVRFRNQHDNQSGIEDVANTLPKIEALSLNFEMGFVQNVMPVTGMTSLKKLEVNLEHVTYNIMLELLRGLAEHSNIEDLHLAHFKCSKEMIGLLSSIKRLKILKFTNTNHLHGNVCN
ncbi:uncharacterized protein LOC119066463 [Bradysia coprophila]|uniref:uncharacterized protein LOC119066463 n=1 Tax=Bradysia coprophila TaxID=38358 RepID=UPI00187DD988|nr:uncharacterized protein LOC119066463 [Bradysia coprophila]